MPEFAVGDRVKIKPELAEGFTQPCRTWAKTGRPGTVITINTGWRDREVRVQFDSARKPKRESDYRLNFEPRELEKLSSIPEGTPKPDE